MRCSYCGKDIPVLYPFSMCPSCGQPIDRPAAQRADAADTGRRL